MKRTPRQPAPSGAYRCVAAILAVLWGLPLFAFWGYASAVSPAPTEKQSVSASAAIAAARVRTEDAHKTVCSCANCPGGKRCCCSKASSPAEGFVISALCDDETPLIVVLSPGKIAFLATTVFAALPDAVQVHAAYATSDDTAPSHRPTPFHLPPRLS